MREWTCPGCKRTAPERWMFLTRWIRCGCGYKGDHPLFLRATAIPEMRWDWPEWKGWDD